MKFFISSCENYIFDMSNISSISTFPNQSTAKPGFIVKSKHIETGVWVPVSVGIQLIDAIKEL